MRRLAALAAGACAVLSMSACRVDSVLTVRIERDGSGTVVLEAVADAAVVQAAPGLAEDLRLDDAVAAGWTAEGPTPTDDGGLRIVLTRTFATIDEATVLVQSVSGPDGPLRDVSLVRTGGIGPDGLPDGSDATVELRGALGIEGGLDAFADEALLAAVGATPYANELAAANVEPSEAVSFRLDIDARGEVVAGAENAENADGIVRWTTPLDGSTSDLATTFRFNGSSGSGWSTVSSLALTGLVAWCIAAVALIAVVSRARKRRLRAAALRRQQRPARSSRQGERTQAGR